MVAGPCSSSASVEELGGRGMLDVWAAVGGEPRAADCQLDLDEALDLEALNFSPIGAGV